MSTRETTIREKVFDGDPLAPEDANWILERLDEIRKEHKDSLNWLNIAKHNLGSVLSLLVDERAYLDPLDVRLMLDAIKVVQELRTSLDEERTRANLAEARIEATDRALDGFDEENIDHVLTMHAGELPKYLQGAASTIAAAKAAIGTRLTGEQLDTFEEQADIGERARAALRNAPDAWTPSIEQLDALTTNVQLHPGTNMSPCSICNSPHGECEMHDLCGECGGPVEPSARVPRGYAPSHGEGCAFWRGVARERLNIAVWLWSRASNLAADIPSEHDSPYQHMSILIEHGAHEGADKKVTK